jgi:alpha-N-arabinofuranosidase
LFANNSKGNALLLHVDSPMYETQRFGAVPYLDTSAAFDNGSLVLNVVNRHRDQPVDVQFEAQDKQFTGSVEAVEVNGPDIKAENDFGSTKVQATKKAATTQGKLLQYSFPPHSYTMLKASLRAT